MPVEFEKVHGNVVCVHASGRLNDTDYKVTFVPTLEDLIRKWGRLRLLLILDEGFEGWDLHAGLDELRFELAHMHDLLKVGVVGAEGWHRMAAKLTSALTSANVRFYEREEESEARAWVASAW